MAGILSLRMPAPAKFIENLRIVFSEITSGNAQTYRNLALMVLTIQIVLCIAAIASLLMLHADGAFFVFALASGEPWTLKWSEISARVSVYLLTVLPTQLLADLFDLAPTASARLNAFFFYGLPALQFALAAKLVWQSRPELLLFPIANYVFATSLGYGFPSEILLAPGFLWIALFLIARGRAASPWFLAALASLIFSHELALPSALIAAGLALHQIHGQDRSRSLQWFVTLGSVAALIALFFSTLLMGGAEGSKSNLIYVVDPRRIFNNPTLWLLAISVPIAIALNVKSLIFSSRYKLIAGALLLAATPLILQQLLPNLDFEQGRYSSRSIIGGAMFVLSVVFAFMVATQAGPKGRSSEEGPNPKVAGLLIALSAALALTAGSSIAFLRDWNEAVTTLNTVMDAHAGGGPQMLAFQDATKDLNQRSAAIQDRIDFHWVLPFRSAVLANGSNAPVLVYKAGQDFSMHCTRLSRSNFSNTSIPPTTIIKLRDFTCAQPIPEPLDTLSRRWSRKIRHWLSGGEE